MSISNIRKGNNVAYDYYHGIKLDELEEVLGNIGFVKEYECPIDENDKFIVYAHLEYGALLSIETWSKNGEDTYNSIRLTIPTDQHFWYMSDSFGMTADCGRTAEFNLVSSSVEQPIRSILELRRLSTDWEGKHPHLWHYGDNLGLYDTEMQKSFQRIDQRVFEFKDDLNTLFNFGIEKR